MKGNKQSKIIHDKIETGVISVQSSLGLRLSSRNIVTRNRLSGNRDRLNRNLYFILKFTERPKTPGTASKKTVLSLKEISSFEGNFALIWMNKRLIWFNLQRDGTRNGLSNIKETFAENLQLKMSVLCAKV